MLTIPKRKAELPSSYLQKIPDNLIFEIMDGQPFYYKGYKEVLLKKKTTEDIMGTSGLQGFLLSYLLEILYQKIFTVKYRILTGEIGVHIDHRNNLANDIAIYEKTALPPATITNKYIEVPCKIAIEIDVKADLNKADDYNYVYRKTQKLLDFGTEKVIWIFSQTKKVLVATNDENENWQIIDWQKNIEIIDNQHFNIEYFLKEEGIEIISE